MRSYFNGIAFGLLAAVILVVGGSLFAGHVQSASVTDAATVKFFVGESVGSGVHIGEGYIITAAHVVDGAKTARVKARDGKEYEADVLWANRAYDIALVQVADNPTIPAASMSCRTAIVGENIKAVGNPFGIEFLSAFGRISGEPREFLPNWKLAFVVDMTMLGGQSGGPVFDESGSIIAIIVGGMLSPSGKDSRSPTGYNFAVPSAVVCKLLGRSE
jgi:S1-C subfamily serine protease